MGRNDLGQLGNGGTDDAFSPERIDIGARVLEIQSADDFSIALCGITQMEVPIIIHNMYGHHMNRPLPQQLMRIIIDFCGIGTSVYGTGKSTRGSWKQLRVFETKNIQQIACGENFALFLDSEGQIPNNNNMVCPHIMNRGINVQSPKYVGI